jgi:hypothetical protein
VRRDDQLGIRKQALGDVQDLSLPRRMQVRIDLVDQNDDWERKDVESRRPFHAVKAAEDIAKPHKGRPEPVWEHVERSLESTYHADDREWLANDTYAERFADQVGDCSLQEFDRLFVSDGLIRFAFVTCESEFRPDASQE